MFASKDMIKTNTLDKALRSFILITIIIISFLVFTLVIFFVIHLNISKYMFGYLSYLFFILTAITLFFIIILHSSTIYVYRTKHINRVLLFLIAIELNFLLPILIAYSGLFKNNKIDINTFFINLNNTIVKAVNRNVNPERILILLPHCMQNSNCAFKITSNINNCQMCQSCSISSIRKIADKYRITSIQVVAGGTAARNIIPEINPKLIIAIACERELVTGIADIKNIPVVGVLNQRPNGPCINTDVEIDEFRLTLEHIVGNKLL